MAKLTMSTNCWNKNRLVNLFLVLPAVVILGSCNSCNTKPASQEVKPVAKQINNINFFLETSASMEGYLRGNSDLIRKIPNFLVDIEGHIMAKNKNIRINYIYDSVIPYKKTTTDFIHDISTTKVATGKSSQMHRVFEAVTNATDSNDISILVSDCILSYTDADIKANPEINVQKADGELKAFVKRAFLNMKRKNACAIVYGFNSKFFGTYYTYQNGKVKIQGDIERPYYIWVIGNKQLVQQFAKQIDMISEFNPELNIGFGLFDEPITDYSLLFKTGHEGSWAYDNNNIKDVRITKTSPVRFSFVADFSLLPLYARDLAYLKANIKLQQSNLLAKVSDIRPINDGDISKAAPKEKANMQNATHIVSIEVSDMFQNAGTITMQLPLQYDTGYKQWSIMNDTNAANIAKKTFAFEHLVDGVREAYQTNNEYYINITINLKK